MPKPGQRLRVSGRESNTNRDFLAHPSSPSRSVIAGICFVFWATPWPLQSSIIMPKDSKQSFAQELHYVSRVKVKRGVGARLPDAM